MAKEQNVEVKEGKKTEEIKLLVRRERFETKDKREMWGYFLSGEALGRKFRIDFNAYDQGGYEMLDMVFDVKEGKDSAELVVTEGQMEDEKTGEIRTYKTYMVQNIDEEGDIISYRVKPARDSDKAQLEYLLRKYERQQSKIKEENSAVNTEEDIVKGGKV